MADLPRGGPGSKRASWEALSPGAFVARATGSFPRSLAPLSSPEKQPCCSTTKIRSAGASGQATLRPRSDVMNMAKQIVVIGAGVIGLSVAYYATRKGHRVIVVERDPEERDGCSFGNAGLVVPSHFVPLAAPGMVAL